MSMMQWRWDDTSVRVEFVSDERTNEDVDNMVKEGEEEREGSDDEEAEGTGTA